MRDDKAKLEHSGNGENCQVETNGKTNKDEDIQTVNVNQQISKEKFASFIVTQNA